MFPSNVRKYAFLGGVSKVKFNGTVYEPDENGLITIDASPFIVNQSTTDGGAGRILDKTWQEINDAFEAGRPVYVKFTDAENPWYEYDAVVGVSKDSEYQVFTAVNGWTWTAYEPEMKPHYYY